MIEPTLKTKFKLLLSDSDFTLYNIYKLSF